jgi:hypothetical protein
MLMQFGPTMFVLRRRSAQVVGEYGAAPRRSLEALLVNMWMLRAPAMHPEPPAPPA